MGCTPGSIIREATYALLHPSVYPFYGLNLLYGMTQSLDLESQLGTASTVVLKAAPIWYLVLYSKFVEPRRSRTASVQENIMQSYYPSCPCELRNDRVRDCGIPLVASFRTERVMALTRQGSGVYPSTSQSQTTVNDGPPNSTASGTIMTSSSAVQRDNNQKHKTYFILGLISSSIGDAFLVFPPTFLPGVAMFGIAHVFYILGLRKRFQNSATKRSLAWLVFPVGMMMSPYLLTGIDSHTLGAAVVAYNFTINAMLYQAVSALEADVCNSSAFLAMLGALSFVFSDSMLALHAWKITLPHPKIIIMTSYYFAQVCLALSIY